MIYDLQLGKCQFNVHAFKAQYLPIHNYEPCPKKYRNVLKY